MFSSDIVTQRLRLVTITTEMMCADLARSSDFSELLHAEVPASWPPEHWEPHVFDFLRTMYAEHPHTYGWSRYVVLQAASPVVIGTVGAFPRSATETEIGYGILPFWQRQGLATEATLALIAMLWEDDSLQTITAQTFPHLTASLRVMEKCGMKFVGPGEEAGAVRYGVARSQAGRAAAHRGEGAPAAVSSRNRSTPAPQGEDTR